MNPGMEIIEKYQYNEYMKKHRGTPGCGGALMIIALVMFAFAFML